LSYTLTVRHGSRVKREGFDGLDEALTSLELHAEEVRAEGRLDAINAFREYGADRQVAARLQLSSGGWLRGREAGVDLMGDGTLVPYTGAIRRRQLEPDAGESPFDAIREALR
jgi:hypothetical protein